MSGQQSEWGEVISGYSRAQALADGVLVDVSTTARELGFRYPVALTAAVWTDCVAWRDEDSERQTFQDETGRLWDVLWRARLAARTGEGHRVPFVLLRIPREGTAQTPERVTLHLAIGPGDQGEPVLTILLPDED